MGFAPGKSGMIIVSKYFPDSMINAARMQDSMAFDKLHEGIHKVRVFLFRKLDKKTGR